MDGTEKIVELPPFAVWARRVNDLEMEWSLQRLRMVWNQTSGTFDIISVGGSVAIRPITEDKKPKEEDSGTGISSHRVVSRTIINGYLYVTVEFYRTDGSFHSAFNYIFAGNEYWYNQNGVWWGTPDFQVDSFHQGTLPPPVLTPPAPSGGTGFNEQQN